MTIRETEKGDELDIRHVARQSWHAVYDPILGPATVDETVEDWYDPARLLQDDIEPPDRPFFVAEQGGDVIGFAEAMPDQRSEQTFQLYRIYVAPDRWGEGVGSKLLTRVEQELRRREVERIELSVLAANEVGVSFYESRGFTKRSTTTDDQFGVQRDTYTKSL